MAVTNALAEDIGSGDITSEILIPADAVLKADIVVKEDDIVVCGTDVVAEVFRQVDASIKVRVRVKDGQKVKKDTVICTVNGPARGILTAERTALNFLARLCAIATKTSRMVDKIRPYKAKILDTRKTTPGMRFLEKYAVKTGGGVNHRFGLFDQVLIKDNHLGLLRSAKPDYSIDTALSEARKRLKDTKIKIEVEVENLDDFKKVLAVRPDVVMLDNMSPAMMKKAVAVRDACNKKIKLEASGNITEENIAQFARCGVDYISSGSLTHSVKAIDVSLVVQ
ncbi:MAG: carboxylating nicotinate-nucleotide diphosphorylase [Candidatus Omnitrophica bacterium]|nr:carboxylating nicotinate-nucleotide diphosphorylase [Candidatus Omnitrophota bacterium]MBU4477683.1 carboxylating nicotinate-nucleotide diphosphorylase [Candidatus Omnitrophota bacterium]